MVTIYVTDLPSGQQEELDYIKAFFGECYGIALGVDGERVSFYILVEDDGQWFVSQHGGGSTFWLPDLQRSIEEAREWLDKNCVKGKWGYTVKKKRK